jgi:hypothetical protein
MVGTHRTCVSISALCRARESCLQAIVEDFNDGGTVPIVESRGQEGRISGISGGGRQFLGDIKRHAAMVSHGMEMIVRGWISRGRDGL